MYNIVITILRSLEHFVNTRSYNVFEFHELLYVFYYYCYFEAYSLSWKYILRFVSSRQFANDYSFYTSVRQNITENFVTNIPIFYIIEKILIFNGIPLNCFECSSTKDMHIKGDFLYSRTFIFMFINFIYA